MSFWDFLYKVIQSPPRWIILVIVVLLAAHTVGTIGKTVMGLKNKRLIEVLEILMVVLLAVALFESLYFKHTEGRSISHEWYEHPNFMLAVLIACIFASMVYVGERVDEHSLEKGEEVVRSNSNKGTQGRELYAAGVFMVSAMMAAVGIVLLGGTHLGFAMFIGGTILAYESYLILRKYEKDSTRAKIDSDSWQANVVSVLALIFIVVCISLIITMFATATGLTWDLQGVLGRLAFGLFLAVLVTFLFFVYFVYVLGRTGCFPGNALVDTPGGKVKIMDIAVGDVVWSWDISEEKRVIACVTTRKTHSCGIVDIVTDSSSVFPALSSTIYHSFLTQRGWVKCAKLRVGDSLLRVSELGKGRFEKIVSIKKTQRNEPVYNLYTTWEHNFICSGFVAHNFTICRRVRTLIHRVFIDSRFIAASLKNIPKG